MKQKEWQVWLGDLQMDSVFFDADCTADDVKWSLVYQDGYRDDIEVKEVPDADSQA